MDRELLQSFVQGLKERALDPKNSGLIERLLSAEELTASDRAELGQLNKRLGIKITNFEKYVDENFDPLVDEHGHALYELEIVRTVSPDAQRIARLLFAGAMEVAKSNRRNATPH